MALLLLFVVGVSAGWFASIVARTEAAGSILLQMAAGLIASLTVGLFMNSGTMLGSISWIAVGSAIAAAAAILVLYHAVFTRRAY